MAPTRRGWRPAIPAAVAGASLSVCAALAFGAGGAITPPQPPKVTDVVCISKCGGVRKATTASKVQLSGRHLHQISKVSFSARLGGRIEANPIGGGSRAVTAKVPAGAVPWGLTRSFSLSRACGVSCRARAERAALRIHLWSDSPPGRLSTPSLWFPRSAAAGRSGFGRSSGRRQYSHAGG